MLTPIQVQRMIHFVTVLPLASRHRISQLLFHPTKDFFAAQSHDKSIDIFRVRTEEEIRKKQARRRKREREKAKAKSEKGKVDEAEGDREITTTSDDVSLVDLFTPYLVVRASGKIRSFAFCDEENTSKSGVQVSLTLSHQLTQYAHSK